MPGGADATQTQRRRGGREGGAEGDPIGENSGWVMTGFEGREKPTMEGEVTARGTCKTQRPCSNLKGANPPQRRLGGRGWGPREAEEGYNEMLEPRCNLKGAADRPKPKATQRRTQRRPNAKVGKLSIPTPKRKAANPVENKHQNLIYNSGLAAKSDATPPKADEPTTK